VALRAGDATFALIHSPIVGPATWLPVAEELRRREFSAAVPDLDGRDDDPRPFWEQHAEAAVAGLREVSDDQPLILVGHSGAGPLLPAIGHAARRPVAAYLFVDAGLPRDGASRLDDPGFATYLRELYAAGGRYPNWTDVDLRALIPNPRQRASLLADLRPPPLRFWEEPIPAVGWPDAPAAFLRFTPNPAYDAATLEAGCRGWPVAEIAGGHFHLLVDPPVVARALLELVNRLR
jgi:thioesterase domain-containing protein